MSQKSPLRPTKSIPGQEDLLREVLARYPLPRSILDIGTGSGVAARAFSSAGWQVEVTGFDMDAYLDETNRLPLGIEVHPDVDICSMIRFHDDQFGAVWCAHVLEHVLDTGIALREMRRILKPDGLLFLSVPPFKHAVVGGHVSPGWNVGLLMYVLAVAGFDLHRGSFVRHGYNVFGIVRKGVGPMPDGMLRFARGDIETLGRAGRFPNGFDARQGFDGNIPGCNWEWQTCPTMK